MGLGALSAANLAFKPDELMRWLSEWLGSEGPYQYEKNFT